MIHAWERNSLPRFFRFAVTFALLTLSGSSLVAQSPASSEVATRIDQQLVRLWEVEQVSPAPPTSREEFLRRVSLDLLGRIPTPAEVRQFASDSAPSRAELVASLVENPATALNLGTFFQRLWFPQTEVDPYRYLAIDTRRWISVQLQQDRPLNEVAEAMIAVPFAAADSQASQWGTIPKTIIEANDHLPERMAANATTSFLGVDLSCAQCHDHPFGEWSQDQFWQTAAFFAQSDSEVDANFRLADLRLEIPDQDRSVQPVLFSGDTLTFETDAHFANGREVFSRWTSLPENEYFARHTVNQVWAELFGDPLVDDMEPSSASRSIRAEMLDELAAAFAESGFRLRWLMTTLFSTEAYQLSSRIDHEANPHGHFHVGAVRGLAGRQLHDSLRTAAGLPLLRDDLDSAAEIQTREDFVEQFQLGQSKTAPRSISQTLALMNGDFVEKIASPQKSPLIESLAAAPFLTEKTCVETIYLATLGRHPDDTEWKRLESLELVKDDFGSRRQRYADLFWVLVNSVEFSTNH